MKIVTYKYNGQLRLGQLNNEDNKVFELIDGDQKYSGNLIKLIQQYPKLDKSLPIKSSGISIDDIEICAPIPVPTKNIFCVGKNYYEHAQEFTQSGFDATSKRGDNIPDYPIIFTKAPTTVVGNRAKVSSHSELTQQLDYEAELALIIGKGGRNIKHADAYEHVFGYTIINDITARDLQLKHRQWFIGKSLDSTCPMGPYVLTADKVDAGNLQIRCWVNNELRQEANSKDLIFDIPTLIETLSSGITLEPGDVISTGTPSGVGIGYDPPRFLSSGDTITIEISGLGKLENVIE